MKKPPIEQKALAIMLTHGIGSTILHANAEELLLLLPEMKRAVHILLGSPVEADIIFNEME